MAIEYAIVAGGCFWCTEAIFQQVDGVSSIESGYIGGYTNQPTYEQVCIGDTGHAEAIRIKFDADKISYSHLLDIHFATHDPTQLNRQGNDAGTQYRSAIFPIGNKQHQEAKVAILRAQQHYDQPVVTTIESEEWFTAENNHQDYWHRRGQQNSYCIAVIPPKLQKLRKQFSQHIK